MTTYAWNTGNGYTAFGQRIGAVSRNDGSVVFCDVDRGIDGLIPADFMPKQPAKDRVMRGYMWNEVQYWVGVSKHRELVEVARQAALTARRIQK